MADINTSTAEAPVSGETEKGPSTYESMAEALQRFNVALTNAAQHPEIITGLAQFKFDDARLSEGRKKYDLVNSLVASQSKEKGEERDASKALHEKHKNVKELFLTSRTFAKDVFEGDPNAYAALKLAGKTKFSITGFLSQAMPFYTNLIGSAAFTEKMGYYGYTIDKLTSEQKLVLQVFDADAAYKKEKGEAVQATKNRDDAFDDLDEWMDKFYLAAGKALKSTPELLKILGM